MRIFLFYTLMLFSLYIMQGQPAAAQYARTETIAAVINEDALSQSDVLDRLRLVIASSGMPDSRELRDKMTPQILSVLIEEKLKLQEAKRMEIEVTNDEVAQGFTALAGQNKMSAEQFRSLLRRQGVSVKSLEDQIRSQIAWSHVIQMRLRPQVTITESEVDAVLERIKSNIGKTEFRVAEIFLPIDKPTEEPDVRRLADKLTRQIREGAPFSRVAAQFSQAAGASKGGDMGWVQEGQLLEELDTTLTGMNVGDLSRPVKSMAGYHILFLRDKRVMSAENLPPRDAILQRLGMERLDRLQRSYLLDLKSQAFIEQRV